MSSADADWLKASGLKGIPFDSVHAVTVPGAIDAWDQLLKAEGTMTLGEALKPAIKLAEKARVAPEKLMGLVRAREGASFAPSGVLRLELSQEERDEILSVARRMLLQIRTDG